MKKIVVGLCIASFCLVKEEESLRTSSKCALIQFEDMTIKLIIVKDDGPRLDRNVLWDCLVMVGYSSVQDIKFLSE